MANVLGGLNYNAVLSGQDYKAYRDLVESEVLKRFLLATGSPPGTVPQTGIVDAIDPSQISASETTRPFLVRKASIDPLQVQVNPGTVVTASGAVVQSAGSFAFQLARTQSNDINVLFIENEIIPGGTTIPNDYLQPLASQDVQNPEALRSVLLPDWNNVTLFPPARKNNIVVIAIISVVTTAGGGLEIQIDSTQNTYPYNRPWFSIVATKHESEVGTGTVTIRNPHGTSTNDLTIDGTINLFQGVIDTGMVVSRDRTVNKMPGAVFCKESIPLNRVKVDTTGNVTANSIYGKVNAKYVELLAFPNRLGSIYQDSNPSNSISAEVIQGSNILVFGPNETITQPLQVEYTEAQALLPPTSAPSNLLSFGVPATDEIIIAGGLTYGTVADPTIDMEGTGPFPRRYTVYYLSNGTLVTYPQILIPAIRLDIVGTSLYAPPKLLQQTARIRLGLTKAASVSTMAVTIRLYGKDDTGAAITEDVSFSAAAGYVDEPNPSTNYDSPNQLQVTTNLFSVLDNIQVMSRTDDGPQTLLQVWGELEPGTTPALNDIARIAIVSWNGQGVANIEDARLVSKGFFRPHQTVLQSVGETLLDSPRMLSTLTLAPLLNQPSIRMFSEDFEDLRYFESHKGFAVSVQSAAVITLQNNGFITAGDTITVAPGKVLTFMTGAPNITIGQVQIGSSQTDTRNNIVATVNDTTFASGVTASLGTGTNVNLQLKNVKGSPGNLIVLSGTLTNPLAFSFSGYNLGYDAYGECYLDRAVVGLKSVRIPDNSNPIPSGYEFRNRYRSRAVAIPFVFGAQQFFGVEMHQEDRFYPSSVRIRAATIGNPNVWTSWQVMTAIPQGLKGFYELTFSTPVHKVQVEYYGRARGLSVYQLRKNV